MKRIISLILVFAVIFSLTACNKSIQAEDLMRDIKALPTPVYNGEGSQLEEKQMDFSVELFKSSVENCKKGNILISPLSVYIAIIMTANGADGTTKAQMEGMLGGSADDINLYIKDYIEGLPNEEKYKLSIANSIWYRDDADRLSVEKSFLQTNADYFGADIYKSAFDNKTLTDINNWVDNNTDGMIDKIIDRIDNDAVMYLINALVFDAQWERVYQKEQIDDAVFTAYNSEKRSVKMMYSTENWFINSDNAKGFKKYYKDGKYSFAAILPDEGIDIYDYIASLEGEKLSELLLKDENTVVNAGIPQFSYDFSLSMNDTLKGMGIKDAFDSTNADFSKMAKSARGNIYIGDVLHKTYIEVDAKGTKAAAVTKVQVNEEAAYVSAGNTVILNRPFVYMILDNDNNLPLFIGAVTNIGD